MFCASNASSPGMWPVALSLSVSLTALVLLIILVVQGPESDPHDRRHSVLQLPRRTGRPPIVARPKCAPTVALPHLTKMLVRDLKVTMLSEQRLDNIIDLTTRVLEAGIPGDLIECGVWQGGGSILMKSVLAAYGSAKTLFCADSFVGLPAKDVTDEMEDLAKDAQGRTRPMELAGDLSVGGAQTVIRNFENFKMMDSNVKFLVGWFNETLPVAPVQQLALLRMDGDMYSSTISILDSLYHKVAPGGYIIIDDYGYWPQCKKAVHDWFDGHGQSEVLKGINVIDDTGVWFRKPLV